VARHPLPRERVRRSPPAPSHEWEGFRRRPPPGLPHLSKEPSPCPLPRVGGGSMKKRPRLLSQACVRCGDLSGVALHAAEELGHAFGGVAGVGGFALGLVLFLALGAEEGRFELAADLLERLVLDLAHALLGDADDLADLLE